MAELGSFNPDAVTDDREILEAGNYQAHIIESSLAETRTGGKMLRLTLPAPDRGRGNVGWAAGSRAGRRS